MKRVQVQALLEMGYSRDLVRNALESKIKDTGTAFVSAEDLVSVLLERENHIVTASGLTNQRENQTVVTGFRTSNVAGVGQTNQVGSTARPQSQQQSEMSEVQDRYMCKVCMENQIQMTFMPCGHLVCCGQCALVMEDCPICRTKISGMVKTYY